MSVFGYRHDDGWRACACEHSRPDHVDTAPDPAGGSGCGMAWRTHAGGEVEERHVTDIDECDECEVQPGGHFRQDASAGLVLPNHQDSSEEKAMVGPHGSGPEVVTLCGSMRFVALMLHVAAEETTAGAIVLAPFAVVAAAEQDGAAKARLDELHRHKIDMAARVVVVTDESGYYGTSTTGEIAYAREHSKPVEFRAVNGGVRS